jgi:hypothetical protein
MTHLPRREFLWPLRRCAEPRCNYLVRAHLLLCPSHRKKVSS